MWNETHATCDNRKLSLYLLFAFSMEYVYLIKFAKFTTDLRVFFFFFLSLCIFVINHICKNIFTINNNNCIRLFLLFYILSEDSLDSKENHKNFVFLSSSYYLFIHQRTEVDKTFFASAVMRKKKINKFSFAFRTLLFLAKLRMT